MYYRHFGLDGSPFRFVPVGRDLYLGRCHREALAALEWGVSHEPSGFTLLIGETGTGKTTLVKSVLARNYARVRAACINNPKLGFDGILRELVRQFGLAAHPTKLEMSIAFDRFLERLKAGERIVIVIDESQSLDDDSLEELRLFSNAGNADEKQLHFVLVGQPELLQRLMQRELRQFNDRIGARALLRPLSAAEARAYLEFRLKARGASSNQIFDSAAIDRIVEHSHGIPRRINVLGHNAMLLAYSAGKRRVDVESARVAISEYQNLLGRNGHEEPRSTSSGWRRTGLAAAAVVGLMAVILIESGIADGPRSSGTHYAGELALKPHTPFLAKSLPLDDLSASLHVSASIEDEPRSPNAASSSLPNQEDGSRPAPSVEITAQGQRREIRVRYGDTLQKLAIRYLGSRDRLPSLKHANQQLRSYNHIYPGQKVYLPDPAARE